MLKRKIYSKLKEWKEHENGRVALLIEGARRIGKSTIVREFGKNEYKSYILIDFTNVNQQITEMFSGRLDLDAFFSMIQFEYNTTLTPRKSLIIFDEVQFCPRARQAIKHLVADGRFDYMETGSLISIQQNIKDILIPSEERSIKMYPMDYEEFRWALDDTATSDLLRAALKNHKPLGDGIHRKLMRDFRTYMLVGGMPQAVNAYISTLNFSKVDQVKREIINLYESDFIKIDATGRIGRLYDNIPAQLKGKQTRYKPYSVINNLNPASEDILVSGLAESMTVNMCYHTADPSNGLAMDYERDLFKIYASDTGLFITLCFKDKDFTDNIIYAKLLSDKLSANLGYVYENVVAQILTSLGRNLFYYTFKTKESDHTYEIDFLIADKDKVDPIEVKSSNYLSHASLDQFCKRFSSSIRTPFVIYPKDWHKDGGVTCLPVYMLPFIDEIL